MRRQCVLILVFLAASLAAVSGDVAPPGWVVELVKSEAVFSKPGVYALGSDRLLVVGEGRVAASLGDARAVRLARSMAERDARRRLAGHLYPNERGRVALEISGQQTVSEIRAENGGRLYMGIVVHPANVKRVALTAAMIFADCRDLRLNPKVMEEMATLPTLLDGGGHIFESPDGWLAVGVGFGEIKAPGDSVALREARKIARVNAAKELSEVVFGAWTQVMEADGSEHTETGAGAYFRDWSVRHNRETVAGEFVNMEEAGAWTTDDDELAMVVVLSETELEWEDADAPDTPTVAELDMPEAWQEAFSLRPQWWLGGAGVAAPDGAGMVVAVGAAKLKGDPLYDRAQAPMAAEIDARRNFLKYFAGFSSRTVTDDIEGLEEVCSDAKESARVLDSFRKLSKEKTSGAVRTMEKVGSWKSPDGKLLYAAYAIGLDNLVVE